LSCRLQGYQAGELDAYRKLLEDHQRTLTEELALEVMRLHEQIQRSIGPAGSPEFFLEHVAFWLDCSKATMEEFLMLLSAFAIETSSFTETWKAG
jgi:hypothetical protein